MGVLLSTGINGFICSAKLTGEKLVNGAKKSIEDFKSGFGGHGWKIWRRGDSTKYCLEIDQIVVRETMTVFELLIQKIRAVKGALCITQASGKIKTATLSTDGLSWLITVEDEISFVANDIIRCQSWNNGSLKGYWVEIKEIVKMTIDNEEVDVIVIPVSEFAGSIDYGVDGIECVIPGVSTMLMPAVGDEIIQFGNSKLLNRQSAIYLHADEGAQPAIDVLFGVNSKSFSGCVKTRIGGDIPGGGGLKGFYCENGMIKCVKDNQTIYQLHPDGSFNLGRGKIKYDPQTDQLTFGQGVVITWESLDDTAKENLKGEAGKDGTDGIDGVNGADGVNGENGTDGLNGKDGNDGLSIIWKGDLKEPPSNPVKNWVYRDTDNGMVYIYNGSAWTLMVADGSDGADGAKGENGFSVFITYNDLETPPATPSADGTADGWHTAPNANCVWMSQKVAAGASSGIWGTPIRIKGNAGPQGVPGTPGVDANLLPWVKDYDDNKTQIGDEYMISPKMFSGTIDEATGQLTGVAIGRDVVVIAGKERTGIFGMKDGNLTFELDSESGLLTAKGAYIEGKFEASSSGGSRIVIDPAWGVETLPGMTIYDVNGDVTSTFNASRVDSIDELYGSSETGEHSIRPKLSSKRSSNVNITDLETGSLLKFTTLTSGVLVIPSIELSASVGLFDPIVIEGLIPKTSASVVVYVNGMVIGSIVSFEGYNSKTFSNIRIPINKGECNVTYTISYYMPGLKSGSITMNTEITPKEKVQFISNIYMSRYFANGFALGSSTDNFFECINADNSMMVRSVMGMFGINLTQNGVQLKINNKWYNIGASGGHLTATEGEILN